MATHSPVQGRTTGLTGRRPLLELPRRLTPAELAGGFGLPGAAPISGRIEEMFRRRVAALPTVTRRLEPLDSGLARETHLEALGATMWAADLDCPGGLREAAEAVRAAPPGPDPARAVDVLLDAFAIRLAS